MIRQLIGYFILLAMAYVLSDKKKPLLKNQWKHIVFGIVMQILLIFAMTNISVIINVMETIANGVMKLRDATIEGTKFVFGYIGGADLPFDIKEGSNTFIVAFQALPTVILVSILSAILTYLKVIPFLSKIIGFSFKKIFGVSNSLGIVSAAKMFLGQFESYMLVKTTLPHFSKSEMFTILSLAFSTASASLMPIYAMAVSSVCPDAITHIVISGVIGVISTLIICKIMMPEEENTDYGLVQNNKPYSDFMTAVSKGTSDGAFVWWAIVGSLIGMVALIALINSILNIFPNVAGEPITLQRIVGVVMYPFAWILGVSDADIFKVAAIIGTKFVINETVAFFDIINTGMSRESIVSTIYAVTNFGNFACIGMTIGGLTVMCPDRKDIPSLGFKAFIAGTLATGLTATLACLFI